MDVYNKIAHVRVIDGLLRHGPPSLVGLRVARVDADDVEPFEVFELHVRHVLKLAAEDEMEKLRRWSWGAPRRGHNAPPWQDERRSSVAAGPCCWRTVGMLTSN